MTTPITILHDSSRLFTPGASFRLIDLASGMYQATWSMGIRFALGDGGTARMIGLLLVRDGDGAIYHANSCGGGEWRERG